MSPAQARVNKPENKPLDIISPEGGCSEGLDAFIFFLNRFKQHYIDLMIAFMRGYPSRGWFVSEVLGATGGQHTWDPGRFPISRARLWGRLEGGSETE